jgi:type IV pilus biogenesis/stability protein PilW
MRIKIASILIVVCAGLFLSACASSGSRSEQFPPSGEKSKEIAEAARNLGEAYLSGGNLITSLRELKKAEGYAPEDYIVKFDIGLVYYYREHYEKAIEYFEKAIQLKPDYGPAINSLGNAYLEKGEWDKAIEAYRKIVEDVFYGTPHFAVSNMALAYYLKKDYPRAEKYFLEALKLSPDFANAQGGLAMTHIATGNYDKAAKMLERAVRKNPKLAQLHYELGRAYRGLGDRQKAREGFQRTIELAQESPMADEAQRQIKELGL